MLHGLNGALSLLTIFPMPDHYPDEPGRAFAFFPLVGVLIGSILWGVHQLASRFLPPDVVAFVVLGLWVLVTGGLHLDGFGDTCDGLFAAVEPSRRLEIMKDSRAGSWAVIGLVLLLLGKWIGLRQGAPVILPLAAAVARWVMVIAAWRFPYARETGMGGYFKQGLGLQQVVIATVTVAVVLFFYPLTVIAVVLAILPVAGLVAWWASTRLGGGLTGDVYGALCELTELLIVVFA